MHLDLKDHVTRLTFFALNLLDEIHAAPQEIDAEECRASCVELLRAFDHPSPRPETFQLAKYALTAWIDDRLSRARWPHAAAWNARPLEQELFGTTCRHWRFFEQAELALRRQDWDALLVFQFCVEFGFRGIYAKERVKVRLNDRLPMSRARVDSRNSAPILAGVLQEESPLGSPSHAGSSASRGILPEASTSSRASVPEASGPVLPPTLAEWSLRTFHLLEERSLNGPAPRLLGRMFSAKKIVTDWAIVMAVGLLLSAVVFAIGH